MQRLERAAQKLTAMVRGGGASYALTAQIFTRFLGLIYLVAFASLWVQLEGLIGDQGILPAREFLARVADSYGVERFWLLPSLVWLYPSGAMLHGICAVGVLGSLLVVANRLPGPILFALWLCYLSLVSVSQDFLSFQWDNLLLETGFLAIFLAPRRWRPRLSIQPSPVVIWLLRWLLFRLMFSSGLVKLLSGDETWLQMWALPVHYETQPLPTWIGWYVFHLPPWLHQVSMIGMFVIELGLPFLIFMRGRPRRLVCVVFILFQLAIIITGNYTFFNWLTIALCILLLDDGDFRYILPRIKNTVAGPTKTSLPKTIVVGMLAVLVLATSGFQMLAMLRRHTPLPPAGNALLHAVSPFRTINRYGLFAVMTTSRPEIIVEGSMDGETWLPYEFKWKPGALTRRPRFVAPHQPRLDWQMWFAALSSYERQSWFLRFMECLLRGSPPVTELLADNPFPERPPRYVRAVVYDYRFTEGDAKRKTGQWWRRELKGSYIPVLSLRE